jgi:hypothetical protein
MPSDELTQRRYSHEVDSNLVALLFMPNATLSRLARFASKWAGSGQATPPAGGPIALTEADWDGEHQLASGERPSVKNCEENK